MSETLSTATIDALARQLKESRWITELRRRALARHAELPWPHPSDDVWRRIDVSQLDPSRGFTPARPDLLQKISLSETQLAHLTQPLGDEQLFVRLNGSWLQEMHPTGCAVTEGIDRVRGVIEADGLTEAEQKLSNLNLAFHHDDVTVEVPPQSTAPQPMRFVRVFSAGPKQALFPMTVITVGAGASVTIIDEYVSLDAPSTEPHLVNARVELTLEPDATVHYIRLQRWGATAREFLLQRATLARGATLHMANINLGAAFSKAHIVTRLAGEHATANLRGFVFGHGRQHIDQHTLQDHQAPHTTSDLQVNAALQDESRMTYTGLIRIAQQAAQTQAFQVNRNLMLSKTARAESIPMLEILADDVQCKHAASVGPIDDEQAFYLMSRGIAHEAAERLIVMGFVESIIQQLPFAPLQEHLRQEIEGGLRAG